MSIYDILALEEANKAVAARTSGDNSAAVRHQNQYIRLGELSREESRQQERENKASRIVAIRADDAEDYALLRRQHNSFIRSIAGSEEPSADAFDFFHLEIQGLVWCDITCNPSELVLIPALWAKSRLIDETPEEHWDRVSKKFRMYDTQGLPVCPDCKFALMTKKELLM